MQSVSDSARNAGDVVNGQDGAYRRHHQGVMALPERSQGSLYFLDLIRGAVGVGAAELPAAPVVVVEVAGRLPAPGGGTFGTEPCD